MDLHQVWVDEILPLIVPFLITCGLLLIGDGREGGGHISIGVACLRSVVNLCRRGGDQHCQRSAALALVEACDGWRMIYLWLLDR